MSRPLFTIGDHAVADGDHDEGCGHGCQSRTCRTVPEAVRLQAGRQDTAWGDLRDACPQRLELLAVGDAGRVQLQHAFALGYGLLDVAKSLVARAQKSVSVGAVRAKVNGIAAGIPRPIELAPVVVAEALCKEFLIPGFGV
jgi:hypothetical protein